MFPFEAHFRFTETGPVVCYPAIQLYRIFKHWTDHAMHHNHDSTEQMGEEKKNVNLQISDSG